MRLFRWFQKLLKWTDDAPTSEPFPRCTKRWHTVEWQGEGYGDTWYRWQRFSTHGEAEVEAAKRNAEPGAWTFRLACVDDANPRYLWRTK